MKLQCLIIDDEPPAHKVLESYISKLNTLELAGNCYNAIEALEYLRKNKIDILFLDINMPELTGLEMLKMLSNPPAVILTTAYSEFALDSYELGVIDYLLKPIRFDRFLKAVNRVLDRRQAGSSNISQESKVDNEETFIFIKADGVKHKVWFKDINYIESKGNFVQLHLEGKRILTANTLTKMAEKLEASGFLRVHKSYIINLKKVNSLQGNLLNVGNDKIPIGNSYRQIVLNKIGV